MVEDTLALRNSTRHFRAMLLSQPRRAGAYRPSLVPEAIDLTRPSYLSPNEHASASTRDVLALPQLCREG